MGLIRTGLAISTLGTISPRSRKQRVAVAQLRELKKHTTLLEQIADPGKAERERVAREERMAVVRADRATSRVRRDERRSQRQAAKLTKRPILATVVMVYFLAASIGTLTVGNIAASVTCLLVATAAGVRVWQRISRTRSAQAVSSV